MVSSYRQVLYRSIPRHPDFDPGDVAILRTALRFNACHGITGYLVRTADQFLQALHGPSDCLTTLLGRIAVDDRHYGFDLLLDEPCPDETPFPGWALGYDHFFAVEHGLERAADGSRAPLSPDRARDLLSAMAHAAAATLRFGSGFPQARLPGEGDETYLARLDGMT